MGTPTPPNIWFSWCSLGLLAAPEGHQAYAVAPLALGKCAVGKMCPPPGKRQPACAPCVTRAMAVQPNCGSSNVPPGNLPSGKPGSVTGDWTEYATSWYDQATHNDLVHISRLRIPQSFVDGLPRTLRPALRERVAYHQYHLLLSVTSLRGELPMPPRCTDSSVPTASISAWFGSLHRRKPNQTRQQKTCGNRYTSLLRQVAPTQTHPPQNRRPPFWLHAGLKSC
jgi:hypothetical protein